MSKQQKRKSFFGNKRADCVINWERVWAGLQKRRGSFTGVQSTSLAAEHLIGLAIIRKTDQQGNNIYCWRLMIHFGPISVNPKKHLFVGKCKNSTPILKCFTKIARKQLDNYLINIRKNIKHFCWSLKQQKLVANIFSHKLFPNVSY